MPLDPQPIQIISVVTKAELLTFAVIAGWETKKLSFLESFLKGVTYVDINNTDEKLIDSYKFIDAYSKCKVPDNNGNYKEGSHVKMGKNDIWIAATTKVLNATLITVDNDFDHLSNVVISIKKV